ncbi:MAG TPA: 4'-phosphopantetheinyl transferase superfamily protein [Candidatus Paceibacterota bacterium]|nr:4'-phosphopantetheinyl transferase superfamily protein [Candidatus Paceibacterota bacterium]
MTTALTRCTGGSPQALHEAGEAAARAAVREALKPSLGMVPTRDIVIAKDMLGKPSAYVPGRAAPIAISISHAFPFALGIAETRLGVRLGADIERVREFTPLVLNAFLTPAERALIAQELCERRPAAYTRCWSIKEAVLKALGVGLRTHPRHIDTADALASDDGWIAIKGVRCEASIRTWRVREDVVAVAVVLRQNSVSWVPTDLTRYAAA